MLYILVYFKFRLMLYFIEGWAMQADSYIFLDRNWEKDKSHIKRILKYQIDLNSVPNILLFPEGITNFNILFR